MIAVDTCVLARFLLRDDPAQAEAADELLSQPFRLGVTVILELGWLLRSVGRMDRAQAAEALSTILALPTASVEHEASIRWAIERLARSGDWQDLVHLASVSHAERFVTFDRRLKRQAGSNAPIPIDIVEG